MSSYTVITPVRNEGSHFQQTIDSIVSQTLRPHTWVIVDDGSTDDTPALANSAARQHSWIEVVHRTDRGFRKQGGGVIEAFYDGFNRVEGSSWDFLAKMDGDLCFSPNYFEDCLSRFARDPKLGIGGGRVCVQINGCALDDSPDDPAFHVRGATKIYRRDAWDAIGGLVRVTGWDTLDEVKANMLGWNTYSFRDLQVVQLKPTGAADGSWKNWVKNGRANYISGYHPVFMLLKCLKRCFQQPYGIASLGLLSGFAGGYFRREPQISDRALISYLRKQQIRRLTLRSSIWTQTEFSPTRGSTLNHHAETSLP